MPTGYTENVQSGKVTELKDFALQCARAFGALIDMRDDPFDAQIPSEIKPSAYHLDELTKAEADLAAFEKMDDDEVRAAAKERNEKALSSYAEACARQERIRANYTAMLEKVNAWTPPTPDHQKFKEFMAEQITISIQGDCYSLDEPKAITAGEWLSERRQELNWSIAYHRKCHERDVEMAAEKTSWLKSLVSAL